MITLVGDAQITVEVGTTYTDLGATASDNYDGDITADIVTVNNVDTSILPDSTLLLIMFLTPLVMLQR